MLIVAICLSFAVSAVESDFAILDSNYSLSGTSIEIEDMPRVRSQGAVPDCIGFAAACVAQHYICKVERAKNAVRPPCSATPNDKEISPLSMIAWAHPNTEEGGVAEPRNYSNIQLKKKGGTAGQCLSIAKETFSFKPDSCYPHDQLSAKYGSGSAEKFEDVLKVIEIEYNKKKTEGRFCEDCLKGAISDLNISISIDELKTAMGSKKNFGEFLYKTIFHDCKTIVKGRPTPQFDSFPKSDQNANYKSMIEKVKEVLKSGNPLTFDDVCLNYSNSKCTQTHSLVIAGYRKMCKSDGTCRDVVKVQNSFGKDWQEQNADGWLDAETLFRNTLSQKGRAKNSLAWYY